MTETALTPPEYSPATDQETAAQLLAEMDRIDQRMDRCRSESERLKVETQVIKSRTEVALRRLGEQIDSLARSA